MGGLDGRWKSYFRAHSDSDDVGGGPGRPSATIDLVELYGADPDLAQAVLERPARGLETARTAFRGVAGASVPVQLRVENNPHLCGVGEISARHLYDLVTVQGTVETVGSIGATPVTARYRCRGCGATQEACPDGLEPSEPARCGSCGWDDGFEFRPEESEFVDTQPLTLVPLADEGTESLRAYVYAGMVGGADEGDHVGVTGIFRAREGSETPVWERYLDGFGIRAEREISPPRTLTEALDAHWVPR